MNKKEKLAFAFVGVGALVGGVFLGNQINSAPASRTKDMEREVNTEVDCGTLEAIPTMLNMYLEDWDRGALDLFAAVEGVTEKATNWTSSLETKDKRTFKKLRDSARTVALETFNFQLVRDSSFDNLKTSLKEAFIYCELDPKPVDEITR